MIKLVFIIILLNFLKPVFSQTKLLYYIKDFSIYSYNIDSHKNSLIYKIHKTQLPQYISDVKYRNNTFVWPINNKKNIIILKLKRNEINLNLSSFFNYRITSSVEYVEISSLAIKKQTSIDDLHGKCTNERFIPEKSNTVYFDDLLISPDGSKIVWNVNKNYKIINYTSYKNHQVYLYNIEKKKTEQILDDYYTSEESHIGGTEFIRLIDWQDSNSIYYDTYQTGQLHYYILNLTQYNIINKTKALIGTKYKMTLHINEELQRLIYIDQDECCCANYNTSNNKIFSYDLKTNSTKEIFNEWKYYKNKVKIGTILPRNIIKDYQPRKALLSKNGNVLCFSSWGIIEWGVSLVWFTYILPIDKNIPIKTFKNKIVLDWLNDNVILIASVKKGSFWTIKTYDRIYVYNLTNDSIVELPIKNFYFLGIK